MGRRPTKRGGSDGPAFKKWLKKWWIPIAVVVAVPAFALAMRAAGGPGNVPIDEAVLLDGGELLLVGTTGRDIDVRRSGRVMLLSADGTVKTRVDHEGELRLVGIAGDVLWLDNPKLGVHARRLDDLALLEGSQGNIEQHPALATSARALGMADGKVVLEGADRFLYTLGADGTIAKQPKGFDYARARSPESLGPSDALLPEGCVRKGDGGRALMKVLEEQMTNPVPIACGRGHGLVAFADPDGRLVLHTAFDTSGRTPQVSRVDLEGAVVWSSAVLDLVAAAPFEDDGATTVPWIGFVGGELRAIVQRDTLHRGRSDDSRSKDYRTVEHRLARIDPSSGAALGAAPIVVPEI